MSTARASLAMRFRDQNRAGRLLLPNAWDAASARIFEEAGFPAVATTSAGIAYTEGVPDAEHLTRNEMVRAIARIARGVSCPVSADIEAGYGAGVDDVAQTACGLLLISSSFRSSSTRGSSPASRRCSRGRSV